MTWGHAVSVDLAHWHQLPHALLPYDEGTIFSGSAVVDEENLSGFGQGAEPPLVVAFTHARKPFGQALAFSNDKGRTWHLYDGGRPVVPNQGLDAEERDPKVFWHGPSRRWIMVLWVQRGRVRFFTSGDLKQWTHASDFTGEGLYECPDLFELPVDGNAQNRRWILHDAALNYWVGTFDGTRFRASEGPVPGDYGGNFYAAQTWNNTGGRVLQIGWMRGGAYPGMPFNQQMSFPCELALRKTASGLRLCRLPAVEIKRLRAGSESVSAVTLAPDKALCVGTPGDLFDIEIAVELSPGASFAICLHDQDILCGDGRIRCLGKEAPLATVGNRLTLRILVDRTSIELYGNEGDVVMSSCLVPVERDTTVQCRAVTGTVRIYSLTVHRLSSAW
jgi:sucrose-6-phosphate hydrolase SacC (GH32 family)